MFGFKTPAGQSARKDFTRKGAALAATPGDEGEDQVGRAASGPVRGPGTGTSDDVQTAVPQGTYIMPADSTEKIGEQKLAAMGFTPGVGRSVLQPQRGPGLGFKQGQGREMLQGGSGLGFKPAGGIPVNLSNGEFQLSPEQVHAIGVEALEGLKAATHEPVAAAEKYEQAAQAAGEDPARPDLFFADGGVVEDSKPSRFAYDPNAKPYGANPSNVYGAPPANPGATAVRTLTADEAAKANRPAAPSQPASASQTDGPKGFAGALGAGYGATLNKLTYGLFDDRAGTIQERNREGLIAEPEKVPAAPVAPANPVASSAQPVAPAPAAVPSASPDGVETSVPGIQRINQPGQSPMFTNVGTGGATTAAPAPAPAGFTPGEGRSPDVMSILQRESQIRKEMAQDAAGPKPERQGWNGTNWEADERQRRRDFDNFSARSNLEGALYDARRSGRPQAIQAAAAALTNFNAQADDQLNKSQAQGFMAGDRAAAISRDQVHQDLARRALDSRQSQAEQEIDLRKREIAGRQDLAGQELGIKREAQGFQTRAAQRQEALQARYEAAKTPEERSAIAQQIRDLSGKELPNRFTVVPGGQEIDPATNQPVRRPDRVLNNQTGQFVDQPGASASIPAMPADKSQRKAGMTYTLADGRRVKWDGTGAVEVR